MSAGAHRRIPIDLRPTYRQSPSGGASRLLVPLPVAALLYLLAVRWKLVPTRPDVVWVLAIFPLAALALGTRSRSWSVVAGALIELALCVPLHGLLTFIHAWRLE